MSSRRFSEVSHPKRVLESIIWQPAASDCSIHTPGFIALEAQERDSAVHGKQTHDQPPGKPHAPIEHVQTILWAGRKAHILGGPQATHTMCRGVHNASGTITAGRALGSTPGLPLAGLEVRTNAYRLANKLVTCLRSSIA